MLCPLNFVFSPGVLSSFCVASFRSFVFSRGVFSLFRLFAWRLFVISPGETKRRNNARRKDGITKRSQAKRRKTRVENGVISHGVFRLFALVFRHFAWRFSLFRLFARRYFVFSLFRLAFVRNFVFRLALFRFGAAP